MSRFRALRVPVRSLIYLFWVYSLAQSLLGAFLQIYLFQRFKDISLNVVADMIFFTGILVGFVIVGFAAGRYRLNIKHGFLASFVVTGASIVWLLAAAGEAAAYAAMFAYGVGLGLFWLTIHTFELHETKSDERDFYSSLLTVGERVFSLAGPAIATLLIWLSGSYLGWGEFTLLFIATPLVYLLGLFSFAGVSEYRPSPVSWADVRHFVLEHRNRAAQLYLLGSSMEHMVAYIVPPLIALYVLGGPLAIGAYNTVLAVLAAVSVLMVAQHRTSENRLLIYAVTTAVIAFVSIVLGTAIALPAFLLFTVVVSVAGPVRRVSEHVIDLETMESIGRPETDFFATMLLRDLSLWVWRMCAGFLLLWVVARWGTGPAFLSMSMYLAAALAVVTYAGAYLLLRAFPRQD